jgi:hypothetical protein
MGTMAQTKPGASDVLHLPHGPQLPHAPAHPFCKFSRPARASGGIGIQSYDLKPGGSRGKSQLAWSFNGALGGIASPVPVLAASFAPWRAVDAAPALGFTQVASGGDIAITGTDLGAPDASGLQVLGQTAPDGTSIQFNSRLSWSAPLLQRVATHEIGHALGLLHATTSNSIMYPIDQGVIALGPDDKAAIRALYGWSAQSQIQGGSVAAPALAACGNTLARAWRGTGDDQNIWFSTSSDGSHWSPQRKIPGAASAVGPALAWDGSRLWMAWRGINDDHNIYWANTADFFNGNWTGVQRLGDRASSHAPSIAFAAGAMVMAWKGIPGDSGLYYARFAGGWSAQQKIGGVGSACAPAVCQDLDPRAVRMVWRGVNDDQSLYTSTLSDQYWQPQQKVSWIINGNGALGTTGVGYPGTADSPAAAYVAGKVMLAWRGVTNDSGLWFTQLANDSVGGRTVQEWSAQANIPQVGSSNGPSVAPFEGRIYAVWKGVGADHALWSAAL